MKPFALIDVLGLAAAFAWQHVRYLKTRRGPVQDRQSLLYPRSTFHVLSLLRVGSSDDAIEALRMLRNEIEAGGQAKMVYAGPTA